MLNITAKDIERFIFLASNSSYNEELKEENRKLGRKILKAIAFLLDLDKSQYDIRWNPGGIAVCGDHTLHTDRFYLALHGDCGWFYWRTCKGRKDYTGGRNHIVRWETLRLHGLEPLVNALEIAQNGYAAPGEDTIDFNTDVALLRAQRNGMAIAG